MKRTVHLGTRRLEGLAGELLNFQHWAVKVGDKWISVEGASKQDKNGPNRVR